LGPAYADDAPSPSPAGNASLSTDRQVELFSARVRRSTVTYLRLRLLELHEEGLDRARAAIEHRLSIDDLLADPLLTPRRAGEPPSRRSRPGPAVEKAQR